MANQERGVRYCFSANSPSCQYFPHASIEQVLRRLLFIDKTNNSRGTIHAKHPPSEVPHSLGNLVHGSKYSSACRKMPIKLPGAMGGLFNVRST